MGQQVCEARVRDKNCAVMSALTSLALKPWTSPSALSFCICKIQITFLPRGGCEDQISEPNVPSNSKYLINVGGFPGGSDSRESTCNAGDPGSIPGSGRSPGGGNGNPLQYSCLENPMGSQNLDTGEHACAMHD